MSLLATPRRSSRREIYYRSMYSIRPCSRHRCINVLPGRTPNPAYARQSDSYAFLTLLCTKHSAQHPDPRSSRLGGKAGRFNIVTESQLPSTAIVTGFAVSVTLVGRQTTGTVVIAMTARSPSANDSKHPAIDLDE